MRGLLAFFDILGYQSFLENNSAADSALKVLRLINQKPLERSRQISEEWEITSKPLGTTAAQISGNLKHLIFSDTIVLALPYPKDDFDEWMYAAVFLSTLSAGLCADMFEEGLPVRGVLVEGDFFIQETCLAGKAVVEAYRLCTALDFSGLVFDLPLAERLSSRQIETPFLQQQTFDQYFVPYLSPLKGSLETRLLHMNWVAYYKAINEAQPLTDIDTFVLRSFWAHRKDCPLSVDPKIANTQKLVRFLAIAGER